MIWNFVSHEQLTYRGPGKKKMKVKGNTNGFTGIGCVGAFHHHIISLPVFFCSGNEKIILLKFSLASEYEQEQNRHFP